MAHACIPNEYSSGVCSTRQTKRKQQSFNKQTTVVQQTNWYASERGVGQRVERSNLAACAPSKLRNRGGTRKPAHVHLIARSMEWTVREGQSWDVCVAGLLFPLCARFRFSPYSPCPLPSRLPSPSSVTGKPVAQGRGSRPGGGRKLKPMRVSPIFNNSHNVTVLAQDCAAIPARAKVLFITLL